MPMQASGTNGHTVLPHLLHTWDPKPGEMGAGLLEEGGPSMGFWLLSTSISATQSMPAESRDKGNRQLYGVLNALLPSDRVHL
jgi:hypothetical protein